MDIDKVSKTYPKLIKYMKAHNFGRVALMAIPPMVRKMIEHKGEYVSYYDFYEKFVDKEGLQGNTKRLRYYRTTVRHIWAFDEYGHYPDRMKFLPVEHSKSPYKSLTEVFKGLVDEYDIIGAKKMLASKTITVDKNIAIKFFGEMQILGAKDIDTITPQMVVSHFYRDGTYIRGNDIGAKLKKFLSNYYDRYPHLVELCKFIPKRKDVVKLQHVITDEDIKKGKECLNDNSINICLRDKAIVAIVIYTGMRGADVADLTIDDIDWANDRIRIIQSKTKQHLTLPMNPCLGNILYEYVIKEWPKDNKSRKLFFNMHNADLVVKPETVGGVIQRYFEKIDVSNNDYAYRTRVLRHYLASKLLSYGAEPAVISSILGHTDPNSLNHYLDMDIENLRQCGLDISMFPVNEEVFK